MSPNCSCVTRNGSPCGRKVTDGSQPPVCHVHRLAAQGKSVSPLTQAAPFDPVAKMKKIAMNDRHPQQLQALKELRESGCVACAARQRASADLDLVIARATEEQRTEMRGLLKRLAAIKDVVRGQPLPVVSAVPAVTVAPVIPPPPPTESVEDEEVL